MNPTDIGLLVIAVLVWAAVGIVHLTTKTLHHDEIFVDVPPGAVPPRGEGKVERIRGLSQEYDGEVAVAFEPPRGVGPGLIGTIIDGSVDSRDLTATLVHLAARGHLHIEAVEPDGRPSEARKHFSRRDQGPIKTDWIVSQTTEPAYDLMDDFERELVDGLFHGQQAVRFSQLDNASLQALREAQVALYKETVQRGWYRRHPRTKGGSGCAVIGIGVAVGVLMVLVRHTWQGIVAAVLVVGAAVVLSRILRGRTPRTALGTAIRIQALGFRQYLATAEADQFKFEEASGIFSRYLPYAMALGVAQHWAQTFASVARGAEAQGYTVAYDLNWIDGLDALDFASDVMWWDSLDGDLDFLDGLTDLGDGAVDAMGDAATGLGEATTGLGEFLGSLDFLDGLGNGCDAQGCADADGCGDVAGCIDF